MNLVSARPDGNSDWSENGGGHVEVEQYLLGALLAANGSYDTVAGIIGGRHFGDPVHARIYESIADSIERGEVASAITLAPFFDTGDMPAGYLRRLELSAMTASDARAYAVAVRRLANARGLQALCTSAGPALADPGTLDRTVGEFHQLLDEIRDDGVSRRPVLTASEAAAAAYHNATLIRDARAQGGAMPYIETGIAALDREITGLWPGNLIVIAGRPGMGKTGLTLSIAYEAAAQGRSVVVESLEMSADEVGHRLLARHTGIPVWRIERARLDEGDLANLHQAGTAMESLPLRIDDNASVSVGELRLRAMEWKRRHGLDLLVVDYLQLMVADAAGARRLTNRAEEVGGITRGLKLLARDLRIPVIAVSQLSRQTEGRDNKRPLLSDLRDSGTIEQDADKVLFTYREAYYLKRAEPAKSTPAWHDWQADLAAEENKAEIIVGKQRQGPSGNTVHVAFDPQTTFFHDESDRGKA